MNERDIFLAAQDIHDPAQRLAFVTASCGADAGLRQRVQALLASHEDAGSFLERPAVEQIRGDTDPTTSVVVGAGSGATTGLCCQDGSTIDLNFLTPSDKPGSLGKLAHYDVLQILGRGGFGVVFKAYDENLRRIVAIKVLAPQLATSAQARQRFIREAQAIAGVSHDHVISIHAVAETENPPYLVMNYIAGQSLQEKIDRAGPLGLKEVLRIGMQTAQGLAAAHAQGLVHRDVKPANILLENGVERVKLTDFGLARAADDASLTQSGVIAGTPQYMSPEQADGKTVDPRSDLFSLGSVLYAMCTGHAPFRAESTLAVLKRVCEDTPRPIQEVTPDIPAWLCAIVDRLHAKNPSDRYQSAREVADELGHRLAEVQRPGYVTDVTPYRPAVNSPRRRRMAEVFAIGFFAILVAATIGGIVFAYEYRLSPTPLVEWTSAWLAGLLGLGLAYQQPNASSRWRVVMAYLPLVLILILLADIMWPRYTTRYFCRLLMEGQFEQANLLLPHDGPKAFSLLGDTLTIEKTLGKALKIRLRDATIEPAGEAGTLHTGVDIKLKDGRNLTALFQAIHGKVSWRSMRLYHILQHRQLSEEEWIDQENLQGVWHAVRGERNQKPLPLEQVRQIKLQFSGGTVKVNMPGLEETGQYFLEALGTPRRINVTRPEGTNRFGVMRGLYELEGDRLRICMGEPEDEPTRFETKPNSRVLLVELERQRSGTEHDRLVDLARQDMEQFQKLYNAARIPMNEYLEAQIRWAQAQVTRARAVKDLPGQKAALTDLITYWTKQHDLTKKRFQAGVAAIGDVNAVERELLKAQAALRELGEK